MSNLKHDNHTKKQWILVVLKEPHPFDTGIGIAADHLPHVFEDFYQVPVPVVEQTIRRNGVGLGLGIVKRLAERLDHPIYVRSPPRRGSVFTLQIPVLGREAYGAANTLKPAPTVGVSLEGRLVLVVDDDPLVVSAIKALLSDWGAEVATAATRAELKHALTTLDAPPDFLITDFRIEASLTGEDAIRWVREHFSIIIPAAIMTGNASFVPDRVSLMERIHVFSKPVNPAKLRSLLHFNLLMPIPSTFESSQ